MKIDPDKYMRVLDNINNSAFSSFHQLSMSPVFHMIFSNLIPWFFGKLLFDE